MDNFRFDMTSEGQGNLEALLAIVFGPRRKAIGYAIRGDGKESARRLVFFWTTPGVSQLDFLSIPFKLDAKGAADFATRWLAEVEYGPEPDQDGVNKKGWRAYNEDWGHVDGDHAAFVAISPRWAMYGK